MTALIAGGFSVTSAVAQGMGPAAGQTATLQTSGSGTVSLPAPFITSIGGTIRVTGSANRMTFSSFTMTGASSGLHCGIPNCEFDGMTLSGSVTSADGAQLRINSGGVIGASGVLIGSSGATTTLRGQLSAANGPVSVATGATLQLSDGVLISSLSIIGGVGASGLTLNLAAASRTLQSVQWAGTRMTVMTSGGSPSDTLSTTTLTLSSATLVDLRGACLTATTGSYDGTITAYDAPLSTHIGGTVPAGSRVLFAGDLAVISTGITGAGRVAFGPSTQLPSGTSQRARAAPARCTAQCSLRALPAGRSNCRLCTRSQVRAPSAWAVWR
jgi:hypothetical protein